MTDDPAHLNPPALAARRDRVARAWALRDELVVAAAGQPLPIPGGADQRYDFRPHPDFRYLTGGLASPASYVVFDPADGWTEFLHRPTVDQRVWEGAQDVTRGVPATALADYLAARAHRRTAVLGAPDDALAHVRADPDLSRDAALKLLDARRPKDPHEVALVRAAVAMTARGFARARDAARPGITERAVQVELEAEFFRAGADRTAFPSIVAAGRNAAVLHFPPGPTPIADRDLLLVDAGAQRDGYGADVTRVFLPDRPSPEQRDLYAMLRAAQARAVARCRPGAEWTDVHLATAHDLAAGLATLGVLACSPDQALASAVIARFLPHGVGHLTGLGVRDAGGHLPGRDPAALFAGARLRVNLPLREGYLMTVEPGVYFIPPLLAAARAADAHRPLIHWPTVDRFLPLGGMRIEDDVLITNNDPEVLTADIPK